MINGREVDVLIKPFDSAFPSGHTAQAFALAVTIFMHDKKIGWFFLIGALAIGVARVLANVHYPVISWEELLLELSWRLFLKRHMCLNYLRKGVDLFDSLCSLRICALFVNNKCA